MLRWFLADLRTGRQIVTLPVLSGTWDRSLNEPESLTATLNMADPDTIELKPRISAAEGRTVLGCAVDDVVLAAGPVWAHNYDRDARTLKLSASGLWSYYDHRFVLPVVAATVPVTQFTVPDPSAAGKTKPNPDLGTYLANLEYGTIAKRWVQQAHAWTGGSVPVVFEADRAGSRERNFEGAEFKNVRAVMKELTDLDEGIDIRFRPRLTTDRGGIEWVLETGTDAAQLLAGPNVHRWSLDAAESAVSGLAIDTDASGIAGTAWATGGRSGDSVMVGRHIDPTMTNAGFPLFEMLDSSHTSVEVQATLDAYAREATARGRGPVENWTFDVNAAQQPYLGSYWEGDWCDIDVAAYDPDTGLGDSYLFEKGTHRRRITGMSGDEKGLTVSITTQPEVTD